MGIPLGKIEERPDVTIVSPSWQLVLFFQHLLIVQYLANRHSMLTTQNDLFFLTEH